MKVRDDQAPHRAIQPRDHLAPEFAHGIVGEAGIDDRPPVAVAQQPQVDMVELEGKRHAQPEDTRRDFDLLAGGGRMRMGIMQGHGASLEDQRLQVTIR